MIVGFGTLKALSLSDTAWEAWEANVTRSIRRSTVRRILAAAAVTHLAEAAVAHRRATRAGLDHVPSWTFTTLLYGFPELRRISRRS